MDIVLQPVVEQEKERLYRLLQYSLFEESESDGNEMNEEAVFPYPWFELYFQEDDREAYFIQEVASGRCVGFAMINARVFSDEPGHSVSEFMVIPKYRRKGIGKAAAIACFETHKGLWEVTPSYGNASAKVFWKNVIESYTSTSSWTHDRFVFRNDDGK